MVNPAFSPQEAADFLLSEPRLLSGSTYIRSVLRDGELSDKLVAAFSDAESSGIALFHLLRLTPIDRATWMEIGQDQYRIPREDDVRFSILGAAGIDPDIAKTFCTELHAQTIDDPEASFLVHVDSGTLSTGILRPWNDSRHSSRAIVTLVETYAPYLSDDEFQKVLTGRKNAIESRSPSFTNPLSKDDEFDEFAKELELLSRGKLNDKRKSLVNQMCVTVAGRSGAAKLRQHQGELLQQTEKLSRNPDLDKTELQELADFINQCREIQAFHRDKANAFYLRGLTIRANRPQVAGEIQQRLDQLLEDFAEDVSNGTALSYEVKSAMTHELVRRAEAALIKTEEGPKLVQHRLDEAQEWAQKLGMADVIRLDRIRRQHEEQMLRYLDMQAACELLGFGPEIVPNHLHYVGATLSSAYLEYPSDVEVLIADIECYFLRGGRSPEEEASRSRELSGSSLPGMTWGDRETSRICESLVAELREWAAQEKPRRGFCHSEAAGGGTPYKYSGGSFTGHLILVERVGNKLRLDIASGGYGVNPNNPSEQLLQFAKGLGKLGEVKWVGAPRLSFEISASAAMLNEVAALPLDAYYTIRDLNQSTEETQPSPQRFYIDRIVTASLPEVIEISGRIVGCEARLAPLDESTVATMNTEVVTKSTYDRPSLSFPLVGPSQLEALVRLRDQTSRNGTKAVLHPDGTVGLVMSFMRDEGKISSGLPMAEVALASKKSVQQGQTTVEVVFDGVDDSEQVRRVQAFEKLLSLLTDDGWGRSQLEVAGWTRRPGHIEFKVPASVGATNEQAPQSPELGL